MTHRPAPLPPLSLEDWDNLIGRHLHMIEAGAEICESHVKQMIAVPEWETRAEDKMARAAALLSNALLQLEKARQHIREKPYVR